jgi:pimeloyl-ACP methyl ester carboxylesterase
MRLQMIDSSVPTPDGRTLAVQEAGDPNGTPVLYLTGSPSSRLIYREDSETALRCGVRLLSYDRPGYGGSSRQAGRTVASCAADVRAIAAGFGIERLGVYGISGGGPHALACAALLGELVPAVAVLASVAPWGADGLDFFDGMGEANIEDTELYFSDVKASRAKCEADRTEALEADTEGAIEGMRSLLSSVDADALTGELGHYMVEAMQLGLAPSADGWWDDGVAHLSPWGFELDSITTPVLLLHGREDRFVPFGHGQWLAAHVPGAEARLTDGDGHLTLTGNHLDEVFRWLLARL